MRSTWASQSHFPALLASPDVELTAVCTTRPESAEEARAAFGAQLAFHDFRAMVASPEIDAVAVVVRVPSHYEPTRAAIEAGKHVYTEWPLGRTTAEAEELAALARSRGLQTAVGLQSRVSPTLMYMKEQIEAGYVGEVLSCHVTSMRDGTLERPSSRTWQRDARLGANTLTIANGHVIDALRFVAGNFARVACLVTTQARQWYETDTKQMVEVTVAGQRAGQRTARERCGGVGPCRRRPLGRQRLPDGDLRAGRHAGRHRHCLVAARRDAAPAGRAWRPRAERPGGPRALRVCPGRLPARRSVQCRADVCPVRRGDPHRSEPHCPRSTPRWTCTASSIRSSRRRIRAGSCRSPEALRAPVDTRRRVSTTHRRGSSTNLPMRVAREPPGLHDAVRGTTCCGVPVIPENPNL